MTKHDNVWVVVADARRGRLLECGRTEWGSPHVEDVDRIEHQPEDYEHQKPSPRAGSTGATHHDHEDEEEARRFARKLTRWINRQVERRDIDRLVLFAAPRFLGTLRKTRNGNGLHADVESKEADLTSLTVDELTNHRRIKQLIDAG